MKAEDVPVVSSIVRSGADDRVFDALLLLGPFFVVIVALVGRSMVTTLLLGSYVLFFAGYILFKGVRRSEGDGY